MPRATVGPIELEYDTVGDPTAPPLLLVMGLSYQMVEWEVEFCRQLAGRGFWVIRYDNRDCGLSTVLDELGAPDPFAVVAGTVQPPYTLDDLANDAVGLLDVLGVERAHIVGASMGGMVAQLIAINHPERVLSLTSIMSSVGGPNVVQPEAEVIAALVSPPGETHEERVERSFAMRRLINGAGVPFDAEGARRKAERAVSRSFNPAGAARQFAAILTAPDRGPALARLTIPTLVIHGERDPLVPVDNGRQTAAALPDPELLLIPDMGHNLPERVWTTVIDAIARVASRAGGRRTAAVN